MFLHSDRQDKDGGTLVPPSQGQAHVPAQCHFNALGGMVKIAD